MSERVQEFTFTNDADGEAAFVAALFKKQNELDDATCKMSHEIVDGCPPERIYDVARAWVSTAMQETRNSAYWRERAIKAEESIRRGKEAMVP